MACASSTVTPRSTIILKNSLTIPFTFALSIADILTPVKIVYSVLETHPPSMPPGSISNCAPYSTTFFAACNTPRACVAKSVGYNQDGYALERIAGKKIATISLNLTNRPFHA
jgi:hypothetical protein